MQVSQDTLFYISVIDGDQIFVGRGINNVETSKLFEELEVKTGLKRLVSFGPKSWVGGIHARVPGRCSKIKADSRQSK